MINPVKIVHKCEKNDNFLFPIGGAISEGEYCCLQGWALIKHSNFKANWTKHSGVITEACFL